MTYNLLDDLRTFVTSFVTYVTIVFMFASVNNISNDYYIKVVFIHQLMR